MAIEPARRERRPATHVPGVEQSVLGAVRRRHRRGDVRRPDLELERLELADDASRVEGVDAVGEVAQLAGQVGAGHGLSGIVFAPFKCDVCTGAQVVDHGAPGVRAGG